MTIALRAAGAWAFGSTSVAPALPAGNAAGDRNLLRVVCKPFSATIVTPAGWTRIAAASGTNGSTGSGIDTGSVQWALFYRDWQSGDAAPTVTVTSGNVSLACIKGYSKAADEDWDAPVGAKGSDTSSDTSFSLTMDANPGVVANDMLDTTAVIAGDSATFGTPTISATGATIGTVTESPATEGTTATGNDLEASASHALCTAGPGTAAPVLGWTLSAAQTGGGAIVRLRVLKQLGGNAAASATAAADLAHGVPLGGAAAGQATAAGALAHGVPLAGAAAAQATAAGGLAHGIALAGSATGQATAAGALQHGVPLAGAAAGQAMAAGDLAVSGAPVFDSIRIDATSLVAGAIIVGDSGHGLLGSLVPAQSYFFARVALPADANKEFRGLVTRWPSVGTFVPAESGTYTYEGPSTDFDYQLYVDGIAIGAPVTVNLTSTVADLAGAAAAQAAAGGALEHGVPLSGSAAAQATAAAALQHGVPLFGAALAQALAGGDLLGSTIDSLRVDAASLIAGALVVGDRGHGVLGALIPATGDDGPSFLYNDLSLPADANKEIRGLITRWAPAGTLVVYEDGSFTYEGPSTDFDYQLYVDGIAIGAPVTVAVAMSTAVDLAGNAAAQATATGAIAHGVPLAGVATAQVTAAGNIAGTGAALVGAATAQATVTGNLAHGIPLSGTAASQATAAGELDGGTSSIDSLRVDSASLIAGALVVGDTGHGVLGALIPATGDDGPSFLYNDLSLPADANKEIRGLITRWAPAGTLVVYEDGSFTYEGPSTDFDYQLYVDGIAIGAPVTVAINIASAVDLAGSAAAQATAAAELQHGISLAGAAVGQTAAAAELQHGVSLGGAAQGQATASGDITIGNGIPVVPDAGDRQKVFIGGGGGARGSRDHRLQQERERIRRQNDVIMSAVMSSVLRRPIAFCADPARASPFRAV